MLATALSSNKYNEPEHVAVIIDTLQHGVQSVLLSDLHGLQQGQMLCPEVCRTI